MNIIVAGLPQDIKFSKILATLKELFRGRSIESSQPKLKFWIREQSDIPGTDLKAITVEFYSQCDAEFAQKILNDFILYYEGEEYRLTVRIENRSRPRSPSPYRHRGRSRSSSRSDRYRRYSNERDRSRSPTLKHVASKLDLEIEILRKRRQLIEEERRLLLEKKKLERVREIRSSGTKEFANTSEFRETRHFERETRRRPSPQRTIKPRKIHGVFKQFVLPCNKLVYRMTPIIAKHCSSSKEHKLLTQLIRTTLRKRIGIALEGKDYMNTSQILKLYTKYYPPKTDEDLVKQLMKIVREKQLSYETGRQINTAKETQENDADAASTSDVKELKTSEEENAEDIDNEDKERHEPKAKQDKNVEMKNEIAVSLDGSDVELSLNGDKDWVEGGGGGGDWN